LIPVQTSAITLPEDPYHPTLELTIDTGTKVHELSEKSAKYFPCFRRANFALINSLIACSDWSNLHLCTNITEAVNIFYIALNAVFDTCVPAYYPKISNQPPLFYKELARLKNLKSRLYKKFRVSVSQDAFSRYLSAHNYYLARCKTQLTLDPKQFYNFVNTKRKSSSYRSSLKFENSAANTDQTVADLFAHLFQTTYSTSSPPDQSYPCDTPKSNYIFCPVISESSLPLDLQRVKPVYFPGPDGVPGCVLRYCTETLCRLLHKLFTLSLETSDFPHRWKELFVIPLHQKGDKLNACNYGGTSKLSAISKLFQNIITPHLQYSCRSLISSCQHGFIKRR